MCDSFSKYLWVSSNVAHCCRSYQSMPIFTALHQEISLEYLDGTGFILSSIDNICLVTTSCCNFNVYQFLLVWLHQSPRLVRGLFCTPVKKPTPQITEWAPYSSGVYAGRLSSSPSFASYYQTSGQFLHSRGPSHAKLHFQPVLP